MNTETQTQKIGGTGNPIPEEIAEKIRQEYEVGGKRWETLAHENGLSYNSVRKITAGLVRGTQEAA